MSVSKPCLFCGKPFSKSTAETLKQFGLRKSCSRSCAAKMRKGIKPAAPVTGRSTVDSMAALGAAVSKWRIK